MLAKRVTSAIQPDAREEVREWLSAFAVAVREQDFRAGRALFADEVCAFGTRSNAMAGLEALEAEQWRPTWLSTRGYRFNCDDAVIQANGDMAWAAITWHSRGKDAQGQWFDRYGRATYILQRRHGKWIAVHTHHSLSPASCR